MIVVYNSSLLSEDPEKQAENIRSLNILLGDICLLADGKRDTVSHILVPSGGVGYPSGIPTLYCEYSKRDGVIWSYSHNLIDEDGRLIAYILVKTAGGSKPPRVREVVAKARELEILFEDDRKVVLVLSTLGDGVEIEYSPPGEYTITLYPEG